VVKSDHFCGWDTVTPCAFAPAFSLAWFLMRYGAMVSFFF
jgi:hypothetical protein